MMFRWTFFLVVTYLTLTRAKNVGDKVTMGNSLNETDAKPTMDVTWGTAIKTTTTVRATRRLESVSSKPKSRASGINVIPPTALMRVPYTTTLTRRMMVLVKVT